MVKVLKWPSMCLSESQTAAILHFHTRGKREVQKRERKGSAIVLKASMPLLKIGCYDYVFMFSHVMAVFN